MRLPALSLRPGDRPVLESWCRSGTVEARFATRARIVLLAADGVANREIGELVDLHYNQVAVWRRRYTEVGVAGLADEEGPGRRCVYDHDDVLLLVKTVTEPPPDGATRWTMEALAAAMNGHGVPISASQVWRICRALDLKPWQVQSWMTSHDPDFWERAGDVCGLYLNPPDNVVVWSVDEKTGIQATSRVNPTRPAVPGIPARREFVYASTGGCASCLQSGELPESVRAPRTGRTPVAAVDTSDLRRSPAARVITE
jgi:transposase